MRDFLVNVSRYPTYFISIGLGVFLNAVRPLVPLFKKPTTAIALTGIFIAGFVFLSLTLRAMLGLSPV